MSKTPPPSQVPEDYAELPTPCWHCLTGEGEHREAWHWSLVVGEGGPKVRLARDNKDRLELPITEEQLLELMDRPITLQSVLEDGI